MGGKATKQTCYVYLSEGSRRPRPIKRIIERAERSDFYAQAESTKGPEARERRAGSSVRSHITFRTTGLKCSNQTRHR